jgi:Fe2+ or Zn2+ uptake regulation protein
MKKRPDMYISKLICTECGEIFPIPRRISKQREKGHIKHIWCFKCNQVTKFKENIDNEIYKNIY